MSIIAATLPTLRPLWSKEIRSRTRDNIARYMPDQIRSIRRTHEKLSNGSSTVPGTLNSYSGITAVGSQSLEEHGLHALGGNDFHMEDIAVREEGVRRGLEGDSNHVTKGSSQKHNV